MTAEERKKAEEMIKNHTFTIRKLPNEKPEVKEKPATPAKPDVPEVPNKQ